MLKQLRRYTIKFGDQTIGLFHVRVHGDIKAWAFSPCEESFSQLGNLGQLCSGNTLPVEITGGEPFTIENLHHKFNARHRRSGTGVVMRLVDEDAR